MVERDNVQPESDSGANDARKFAVLRHEMVDRQLSRRGIRDPQVLQAMREVPREEFVPRDQRFAAYSDAALPIRHSQTISQPYTVAFMCQALRLEGGEKVLEIGTGSGYAAAIVSRIAGEVHTVERIPELACSAQERLARLGYANVYVHTADGSLGLPDEAPFDAIVATAGAEVLPKPYPRQLADGGRIVIPLGDTPYSQRMWRITRRGNRLEQEDLGGFAFVPLIGEYGWSPRETN